MACSKADRRLVAFLAIGFVTLMTCGCPDDSHQAPVPDYSNMTDTGDELERAPANKQTP